MSNLKTIEQTIREAGEPLSALDVSSKTGLRPQQVLMSLSHLAKAGRLTREKLNGVYKYAVANT